MNISNAIVFGSNFGLKSHFSVLRNIRSIKKLYIYSPNAAKKNISKKYVLKNFKNKNLKNIDLFSIATSPLIQKKLCLLGLQKGVKYFFLEKPISNSSNSTRKILQSFKSKKIKYLVNFIYPNIDLFKILKKKIKKKKILHVEYKWSFKQAYFINLKKTWKVSNNQGGGIVNFYLIHIFYNLLYLSGKFKILKLEYKIKKKIIDEINVKISLKNNITGKINLCINDNENMHYIKFRTAKKIYELKNISKDWVKNFYYFENNKKRTQTRFKNFNRTQLTKINLDKLLFGKINQEELDNISLAHDYCDKINKLIKNGKKKKYI